MKVLMQKNIKITFLLVLLKKIVCIDHRFTKPIIIYRGENAAYVFIKAIVNINIAKK